MAKIDLTGRRFGRLTVLREADEPYISPAGKKTRRWVCKCDCGNETVVLHNRLTCTTNPAQSCGCLQREKARQPKEDLAGKRFGRWTVIRREKLEYAAKNGEKYGWLCRCDCGTERVVATRSLTHGDSTSCGCLTKEKSLQRIEKENVIGRYEHTLISAIQPERSPNSNNTSGAKGVYWSNRENCWIAKIGVQNKTITIGRFHKFEDAVKARKAAEEQYFAPLIEEYEEFKKSQEEK